MSKQCKLNSLSTRCTFIHKTYVSEKHVQNSFLIKHVQNSFPKNMYKIRFRKKCTKFVSDGIQRHNSLYKEQTIFSKHSSDTLTIWYRRQKKCVYEQCNLNSLSTRCTFIHKTYSNFTVQMPSQLGLHQLGAALDTRRQHKVTSALHIAHTTYCCISTDVSINTKLIAVWS